MDKQFIRKATAALVESKVHAYKRSGAGSFIMPDLLHAQWAEEFIPFYELYRCDGKVAGSEMGKILAGVCKALGLESKKEDRRGKKEAITRYFY